LAKNLIEPNRRENNVSVGNSKRVNRELDERMPGEKEPSGDVSKGAKRKASSQKKKVSGLAVELGPDPTVHPTPQSAASSTRHQAAGGVQKSLRLHAIQSKKKGKGRTPLKKSIRPRGGRATIEN